MPLDKLDPHLFRSTSYQLGRLAGNWTVGVIKCCYQMQLRDDLFKELQTLSCDVRVSVEDACESSAWPCEACHNPEINRVGPGTENDGDACRRPLRCQGDRGLGCIDQVDFLLFEIFRCLRCQLCIALRVPDYLSKLLPFLKPQLLETGPEPSNDLLPSAACGNDTDSVDLRLLGLSDTAEAHH